MGALIIFDVDGTLLETERVTVPAVQRTFAAHGLPEPDAATICSFFGKPVEAYEAWLAEQCPPGTAARIVAETNAMELRLIGSEGRLYPGALETLSELLAAGHSLAVCSNGPQDYVDEFLDSHGVGPFMAAVRARGSRRVDKAVMAGEILGLIPARPAFFVGDRHDDVDAARAHGMVSVGAAYGFGGDAEIAGADARIASVTELPALVARLLAG